MFGSQGCEEYELPSLEGECAERGMIPLRDSMIQYCSFATSQVR